MGTTKELMSTSPSTCKVETEESEVLGHPQLRGEF